MECYKREFIIYWIFVEFNNQYIEQPYNGIYETSLDDLKTIEEISK